MLRKIPEYPKPAIVKILKKEQPSLQEIAQFYNEFEFTASAFEEERTIAIQKGCDDFVRKPLLEEVILELIRQHLNLELVYQSIPSKATEKLNATLPKSVRLALDQIPSELLAQLQQATEIGNIEKIETFIQNIKSYNPELAQHLEQLSEQFDYDAILSLIETSGNKD